MEYIGTNNTNVTMNIPKLVEVPDMLSINSQLYDKSTLQPIPAKFFALNNPWRYFFLERSIQICQIGPTEQKYVRPFHRQVPTRLIYDNVNPNLFYLLVDYYAYDGNSGWFGQYLYRCTRNPSNSISINETRHSSIFYDSLADESDSRWFYFRTRLGYVGQTEKYLIFLKERMYQDATNNYGTQGHRHSRFSMLRILKSSFGSYTRIANGADYNNDGSCDWGNSYAYQHNHWHIEGQMYYMTSKETDPEIVYLMRMRAGWFDVYRYTATTNTLTALLTEGLYDRYKVICNPVKLGNYWYVIADEYLSSASVQHQLYLHRITLNTVNDTCSVSKIPVRTLSDAPFTDPNYLYPVYDTLHSFTVNNKQYITWTRHSIDHTRWQGGDHRSRTLRVENNQAVITDTINLSEGCYGVLKYIEATTLVFLTNNGYFFYNFDSNTEKFELTYSQGGNFRDIGFDSSNRFYASYTSGALDILTYYTPAQLKADFTDENYTKSGSNLDTEVHYYAKNFTNEYIKINVKLTLLGNVVFKQTGEKTMSLVTSESGVSTVPVTITGNGRIQVAIVQEA